MITKPVEEYSELERLIYPALSALKEMKSLPIGAYDYLSYQRKVLYFNLDQKEFKLVIGGFDYLTRANVAKEDARLHQIRVGKIVTLRDSSTEDMLNYLVYNVQNEKDPLKFSLAMDDALERLIQITSDKLLRIVNPELMGTEHEFTIFNIKNHLQFGINTYNHKSVRDAKDADEIVENFHKLRNITKTINRDIGSFIKFINQNPDIKSQMYLSIYVIEQYERRGIITHGYIK